MSNRARVKRIHERKNGVKLTTGEVVSAKDTVVWKWNVTSICTELVTRIRFHGSSRSRRYGSATTTKVNNRFEGFTRGDVWIGNMGKVIEKPTRRVDGEKSLAQHGFHSNITKGTSWLCSRTLAPRSM
jgi:hypothetical protein